MADTTCGGLEQGTRDITPGNSGVEFRFREATQEPLRVTGLEGNFLYWSNGIGNTDETRRESAPLGAVRNHQAQR